MELKIAEIVVTREKNIKNLKNFTIVNFKDFKELLYSNKAGACSSPADHNHQPDFPTCAIITLIFSENWLVFGKGGVKEI